MNHAERREALIRLHTTKLIHARLLGCEVGDDFKKPTQMNVHWLQKLINLRTRR